MVSSQPLPAHNAADAPDVFVAFNKSLMDEPICFGLRKGDIDTLNYFNNWIAIAKAKGWWEERYNYWFLSRAWKDLVQ
jgi:polar amino acid transport system substrate-binding protein